MAMGRMGADRLGFHVADLAMFTTMRNPVFTSITLAAMLVGVSFAHGEDADPRDGGWRLLSDGFMDSHVLADTSLDQVIVAVVDRDGVVTEVWHGPAAVGEQISLVDTIADQGTLLGGARRGNLPAHKQNALTSGRRVIVAWRRQDGTVHWVRGASLLSVFWLADNEVFSYHNKHQEHIVSLPRFITLPQWIGVLSDFEHGPRLTPLHLRSRLREFAIRAERRKAHFQEIRDAVTMDEYLKAVVPYRCEYGECEFPPQSTIPWTDKTPELITEIASSPHYRDAKPLLAAACYYAHRDALTEVVANDLPRVWESMWQLDDVVSKLRGHGPIDWAFAEAADRSLLGQNTSGIRVEPHEIGWSGVRGRTKSEWVDRIGFSRTLILHREVYPTVADVPEAQTALLAEWAELLADDGPSPISSTRTSLSPRKSSATKLGRT